MHKNVCACAYAPFSIVYLSHCCIQALIFIDRRSRALLLGSSYLLKETAQFKTGVQITPRFVFSGLDFLRNKLWQHQVPLHNIFCALFY